MPKNLKPGFYWNPKFTQELTPNERSAIAAHERNHLKYVALHQGVPSAVLAEANRSIVQIRPPGSH